MEMLIPHSILIVDLVKIVLQQTVYQQLPNGEKILVEQTQKAKDNEQAFTEIDMVGTEAIQLRRKYPALQKAWDRYLTVWHLIHENDSDV